MASYDDILRDPLFLVVLAVFLTVLFAFLIVHWTKKKERLKEDIEKIYTPVLRLLNDEIGGIEQRRNHDMARPSYLLRFSLPDFIDYHLLHRCFKRFSKDLSELLSLSEVANSKDCDLHKMIENELKTRVDKMRNDASLSSRLNPALFDRLQEGLQSPLRKRSIIDVENLVKGIQNARVISGDKNLFGETARKLFRSIMPITKEAHNAYVKADEEYLKRLKYVRSRLQNRLGKRRRY